MFVKESNKMVRTHISHKLWQNSPALDVHTARSCECAIVPQRCNFTDSCELLLLFWKTFCRKTVSDLTFFQVVAGSECMLLAFQHPLLSPYLSWKHRHKYSYLAPGYLSGHWDNFCECKQNLLTENLSDGGLGRILWIADIPVSSSSPLILNDLCPPRFSLCPSKSFGQVSYVMFRIQVSSHYSPLSSACTIFCQSFYSHIRRLQLQRFILCKTNQIVFQLRLKSPFQFSTRSGFFVSQFEKSPHFPFSRSNIRFPPVFAPALMTASCVHWQQFFEPKQSSHDHICNIFTFVTALLVFPLSYQPHIDAISNWFQNKRNKSQTSFTESLETDLHRWLGKLGRLMLRDTTKICRHLRLPEECLMKI